MSKKKKTTKGNPAKGTHTRKATDWMMNFTIDDDSYDLWDQLSYGSNGLAYSPEESISDQIALCFAERLKGYFRAVKVDFESQVQLGYSKTDNQVTVALRFDKSVHSQLKEFLFHYKAAFMGITTLGILNGSPTQVIEIANISEVSEDGVWVTLRHKLSNNINIADFMQEAAA